MKQQTLADDLGIRRATLSRIERGRASPSPSTIDALMATLGMDWPDVAERGPPTGGRRHMFDGTWRDDLRLDVCRGMQEARRKQRLTLGKVAEITGMSPAQLSRIERGECPRSRVFEEVEEDADRPKDERRLRFRHPALARLAAGLPLVEESGHGED